MKTSPKAKKAPASKRATPVKTTETKTTKTTKTPAQAPRRGAKLKPPASRSPAPTKTSSDAPRPAKRTPGVPAPAKKFAPRADLGAPVEGFFVRQQPHLLPILEELRALIAAAAPDATAALKWGMPFYSVGPGMMCALAGFKGHVNLILPGPPGTYADPGGLLEGDGKTGRHLKLRTLGQLPGAIVRAWLRTAAERARKGDSPR